MDLSRTVSRSEAILRLFVRTPAIALAMFIQPAMMHVTPPAIRPVIRRVTPPAIQPVIRRA